MDLTIEDARIVVDHEGTDYSFEVVGDTELAYDDSSGPMATAPDEVIEALEARGYVVYRD